MITNPYPESIYKAIKVLVDGVAHIAGRFFRGEDHNDAKIRV